MSTSQTAPAGLTKAINLDVLEAMAGMHGEARDATLIELSAVDALLLNAAVGELRQISSALAGIATACRPASEHPTTSGTVAASDTAARPGFAAAGFAFAHAIAQPFNELQDQLDALHARLGYHDERICGLEGKAVGLEHKTHEMKTAQDAMAELLERQHKHIVVVDEAVRSLDRATGEMKTAQAETATHVRHQAGQIAMLDAGVKSLETRTAELRATQDDMTGRFDRLLEHVERQNEAIDKVTASCERLERLHMATVQQLIRLYQTVDGLAKEIEGWEATVDELQRHVDEVGIEVTVLEVTDKPQPSGGKRHRSKDNKRGG